MTSVAGLLLRRIVGTGLLLASFTIVPLQTASGQGGVPIPIDEQIRIFQSLPAAQRQQLIREMQQQLPPAQRAAIVQMLQGGADVDASAVDSETAEVLQEALRGREPALAAGENPRFEPGDAVVVVLTPQADGPPVPRTEAEQQRLDEFQQRLEDSNPYQLDAFGQLLLPGVPAIALAGLEVEVATIRVQTEPSLRPFTVVLTRLPLDPVGTKALKPFGYDVFRGRSAFTNAADIPAPADYVIGPGDTINVQFFGSQSTEAFLEVSREGTINFPQLGPITVAGLTFADVRTLLTERVSEQMIGVRASITLGELRSINVYLVGEVERQGAYTIRGLSTIANALFTAGGVTTIGSLRNIALRRNNATVSTLDLYDLLLRGDTSADTRLQSGDAILVPPVGPTVAVDGEVRRPAIYEITDERTVAQLVALAGGLNAGADRTNVKLERVVANRGKTVEDIDLSGPEAATPVRDGDVLHVPANLEQLERSVRLEGNVFQPGLYQWFPGMRLTHLLRSPAFVKPKSDLGYVLIRRELAPNVAIEVVSADLRDAWLRPNTESNLALEARDTVYVFNLDNGREQYVQPIVDELEAQSAPNAPFPIVRIGGQVKAAGEYPLESGMRVSDLLRAGGGLSEAAYGTSAELTRYSVINGEYRETALTTVDLAALLSGDAAADVLLTPYDYLNIKEVSRWRGEETITLRGEVTFPGTYTIRRGETLSSVLKRAGGLTDLAFPEGSVFTRVELATRERENTEVLARRIERDLAAMSIADPSASDTITTGQSLITQLRTTPATGRWVIRLDDIVEGVTEADVVVKGGDELLVPDQRQEVTVLGEVQYATSHVFQRALSRDEYIDKSGGLSQRADRKRIYVVRANGEVVAESGAAWFRRSSTTAMRPGDTIVVPLDVDQPLARWSSITQIIYNMAIAAAAVNSF